MQWLSFFKKIQLLIDHMFISIRLFLAVHPSWFDFLYSVLASFSPKKSQVNFSPWRMKPIWSIDCLKCLRQCALDFATLSFIWVVNLTVCGEREVKTKDNFLRFLSFANAFNRMFFFSIVFAFPNSFLSIFFGNRCLFTQPLKLAIFHISSEFIPKIKRKKLPQALGSKIARKREKNIQIEKKLNE